MFMRLSPLGQRSILFREPGILLFPCPAQLATLPLECDLRVLLRDLLRDRQPERRAEVVPTPRLWFALTLKPVPVYLPALRAKCGSRRPIIGLAVIWSSIPPMG